MVRIWVFGSQFSVYEMAKVSMHFDPKRYQMVSFFVFWYLFEYG
jgi:hypothetical protein